MKRVIIALALPTILFSSCQEKAPNITLTVPKYSDSTYVVTPPAADAHNVLVEDFTGASCSNCPTAAAVLEGIETSNANRINVIELFIKNFSQTTPPGGARYDFRTDDATTFGTSVFGGISSMPVAGIDRMPLGDASLGVYQTLASSWNSDINGQLTVHDSVNVSLSSTYNTGDSSASVVATVTYLNATSSLHSLSLVVVEDSFVDKQEDGFSIDTAYHFNNVFRDALSAVPGGDVILPGVATKVAGQVMQRTYHYKLKSGLNPANCKVIAFVHDNGNSGRHVYQSCQARLKP